MDRADLRRGIVSGLDVKPFSYALDLAKGALGEKEQAFVWLEKAYADRNPYTWYLKCDPRFDSLRADARFTDWLRRFNLLQ